MKKNGFTLIELIAIVVMLGLILLIVFPATSRLIRDNEQQEYEKYYEMVNKAVDLYSRTRRDDVGGFGASGCIDDTTINDLVKQEYIEKYVNDDEIECKSPGDYSAAELSQANINPDNYVNIKIENKEGVITTSVSMICKKPNSKKIYYKKLIEKSGSCNRYVAEVTNSLINSISSANSETRITSVTNSGNEYYVTGNPTNNYVWYSGKMWRIVYFNTSDKTIKMVTDKLQSVVTFDASTTDYSTSNINTWLNNTFYSTLYNPNRYLLDAEWDYSAVSSGTVKPNKTNVLNSKVGLLNLYEYNNSKTFLNNGLNFWLLSKTTDNKVWLVSSSNTIQGVNTNIFYGVRPSVVLRPSIAVVPGGLGTAANPYKLVGDTAGNIGTPLNTRTPGEYVQVNGMLFRISSKTSNYTRLVATTTLNISDVQYHYYSNLYSDDTFVADYLNNTWAVPINNN